MWWHRDLLRFTHIVSSAPAATPGHGAAAGDTMWPNSAGDDATTQDSLPMPFLVLHVVVSFFLDLAHVRTRSEHDQALELALLRQQLRLYERTAKQPRPSRWEKVALAALAAKLPDLARVALVFTPATLLRWHREIVKRKWTFDNAPKPGRPPTAAPARARGPPPVAPASGR